MRSCVARHPPVLPRSGPLCLLTSCLGCPPGRRGLAPTFQFDSEASLRKSSQTPELQKPCPALLNHCLPHSYPNGKFPSSFACLIARCLSTSGKTQPLDGGLCLSALAPHAACCVGGDAESVELMSDALRSFWKISAFSKKIRRILPLEIYRSIFRKFLC